MGEINSPELKFRTVEGKQAEPASPPPPPKEQARKAKGERILSSLSMVHPSPPPPPISFHVIPGEGHSQAEQAGFFSVSFYKKSLQV